MINLKSIRHYVEMSKNRWIVSIIVAALLTISIVALIYRSRIVTRGSYVSNTAVATEITSPKTYNPDEESYVNYTPKVGERFQGLPKPAFPDRIPFYGTAFDLDGDGKDETIFYTVEHMTKRPHKAYIAKDGIIIFEYSGASLSLTPSPIPGLFSISEYNGQSGGVNTEKVSFFEYSGGVIKPYVRSSH